VAVTRSCDVKGFNGSCIEAKNGGKTAKFCSCCSYLCNSAAGLAAYVSLIWIGVCISMGEQIFFPFSLLSRAALVQTAATKWSK